MRLSCEHNNSNSTLEKVELVVLVWERSINRVVVEALVW